MYGFNLPISLNSSFALSNSSEPRREPTRTPIPTARPLDKILNNESVDTDDSFLAASAYDTEIKKTKEYNKAEIFFDEMLTDTDEISSLLPCITDNKAGEYNLDLNINKEDIKSFVKGLGISENALFTAIFAYTISRFTGDNKVLFNIIDNGRSRLKNLNSIGMFVKTLPIVIDCKNQEISNYMTEVHNLVYDILSHDF